jgi:Restriction endonuclease fold toxin 7
MKEIPGLKRISILLALIMLITIFTAFPLDGSISSAKAATLKSTSLSRSTSQAGTAVINATDLFVTSDGTAPKAGVDSISVSTIENLLNNSTNVELFTDSSSGGQGGDITIADPITWSTASTLTIDAFHSIEIDAPITVNNFSQGGLNLITNNGGSGGTLAFNSGNIDFASGSGNLTINGNKYALISDINGLTSINSTPTGYYALAKNIDATTATPSFNSPISVPFVGTFEGLGNTISNLSITSTLNSDNVGLFSQLNGGMIENVGLKNVTIVSGFANIGALVGLNSGGTILNSYVDNDNIQGVISNISDDGSSGLGGLVGRSDNGSIVRSYANGSVSGSFTVGGLIGDNSGTITQSYATGNAVGIANIGGLVGASSVGITQSYATGSVTGVLNNGDIGGLVGINDGSITQSYSTGAVSGAQEVGGFIGDSQGGTVSNSYWDTETSGQAIAGYHNDSIGNFIPGIAGTTGLTTAQLQAGLPAGFDPTVWGYKTNLLGNNTGYPVLLWQIVPSYAAGQPSTFQKYISDVSELVNNNPDLKNHLVFTLTIAVSALPLVGEGAAEVALLGEASGASKAITLADTVVEEEGAGITWGAGILPATQRGRIFQNLALKAKGIPTNTQRLTETIDTGQEVTVVPDGLGDTILEVKDVVKLSVSNQFRTYLANSAKTGRPIELIVSPLTKTISAPLKTLIKNTKGTIQIFDPATGLFTPWPGF